MFERVTDAVRQREPPGFLGRTAAAQESSSQQSGGEWVARREEAEQMPHGPSYRLSLEDVIREDASVTLQAAQQAEAAEDPHAPDRLALRKLPVRPSPFPNSCKFDLQV